jgi:hypothetical protein
MQHVRPACVCVYVCVLLRVGMRNKRRGVCKDMHAFTAIAPLSTHKHSCCFPRSSGWAAEPPPCLIPTQNRGVPLPRVLTFGCCCTDSAQPLLHRPTAHIGDVSESQQLHAQAAGGQDKWQAGRVLNQLKQMTNALLAWPEQHCIPHNILLRASYALRADNFSCFEGLTLKAPWPTQPPCMPPSQQLKRNPPVRTHPHTSLSLLLSPVFVKLDAGIHVTHAVHLGIASSSKGRKGGSRRCESRTAGRQKQEDGNREGETAWS